MTSGGRTPATLVLLRLGLASAVLTWATPASAQHEHASPYADSGSRRVKTLTDREVAELLEGEGMGLARPAEMNGYPGPRHVLDLGEALALTEGQRERAQSIFEDMHGEAVSIGTRLVSMEAALDRAFAEGADPSGLEELVDDIGRLHGELRWVHLRAHLQMAAVLSDAQRAEYARLRGYHGAPDHPDHPDHPDRP